MAVELAFVVILAVVVGAIGIVVGMLAAPRLQRLADRNDEEPRDPGD
jgi:hypothetical protein